jgi:hypothetical protein
MSIIKMEGNKMGKIIDAFRIDKRGCVLLTLEGINYMDINKNKKIKLTDNSIFEVDSIPMGVKNTIGIKTEKKVEYFINKDFELI